MLRRVTDRLLALPIHTKILVANSAIVATGAVLGTTLVTMLADQAQLVGLALFVAAGIVVSVVINSVLVRLALRPLVTLARTAGQVRPGETRQRFTPPADADPDTRRLAEALNAMLDRLAADAAALDAGHRQLQALATRTLHAQEDERQRIARELHDETAQVLATLLIQVSLLEPAAAALGGDGAAVHQRLQAIAGLAEAALESVRTIAHDLRPSVLDDLGLPAAIRWYAAHRISPAGLAVTVDAEELRLPAEMETALYRVAQEALTNVLRHAQAEQATVRLRRSGDQAELVVSDDGRGFSVAEVVSQGARERRLGLLGMQERVHLLGGTLRVASTPGAGTCIVARVPLGAARPGAPLVAAAPREAG